jgi:hypothetical protein
VLNVVCVFVEITLPVTRSVTIVVIAVSIEVETLTNEGGTVFVVEVYVKTSTITVVLRGGLSVRFVVVVTLVFSEKHDICS